jgi:hypothetical protein
MGAELRYAKSFRSERRANYTRRCLYAGTGPIRVLFVLHRCLLCTANSSYVDITPPDIYYGYRKSETLAKTILTRTLVVFAEAKDGSESSDGVVVVCGSRVVAVTS